jgi:hypothetical protein
MPLRGWNRWYEIYGSLLIHALLIPLLLLALFFTDRRPRSGACRCSGGLVATAP